MPIIIAKIELKHSEVDAYLTFAASLVAEAQKECGCRVFAFARDVTLAGVIWVIEDWASEEDMANHQTGEPVRDFLERTRDMIPIRARAELFAISSSRIISQKESAVKYG